MTIWDRIRSALAPQNAVSADVEHQLRLATGALLLEMCRADFKVHHQERNSIAQAVKHGFDLTAEETRELMDEAETQADCAVSLQIYTSLIKEYSTAEQKVRLIENLWRVAYADGELHDLEERLVRRVAGLIDVSSKLVERIHREVAANQPMSGDDGVEQPA
ncbi:MAG: TerB family tellurite resistance protein [Xanthomonadales bacterium]|nr:TerB family tellurite resistance protein [Xanthomonadales bacterium]